MVQEIVSCIKMKKEFEKLTQEVNNFEKKAGFEKTSKKQLIIWLKKEIKEYENAKSKLEKSNKLMDMIILIIQISKRERTNLDNAWNTWFKKSKKYLK